MVSHTSSLLYSYVYILFNHAHYCLANCNFSYVAYFAIQLDPMIHVASIGENVTFKCKITSDSPFNVHAVWYDETNMALNSSDLADDNYILYLMVIVMSYKDYQEYTCAVSDNNTDVNASAVLSKLMYMHVTSMYFTLDLYLLCSIF